MLRLRNLHGKMCRRRGASEIEAEPLRHLRFWFAPVAIGKTLGPTFCRSPQILAAIASSSGSHVPVFCEGRPFRDRRNRPTQEKAEVGMPVLKNYSTRDYNGGPQVWTILQDKRGVMYFGNSSGAILEYDGVTWRKIFVHSSVVRSLEEDQTGRIWVGLSENFGYLSPNAAGTLQYVSLLDKVPAEDRNFTDVWQTLVTPQGVFFRSYQRLFRWDGQRMQVWSTQEQVSSAVGRTRASLHGPGRSWSSGNRRRRASQCSRRRSLSDCRQIVSPPLRCGSHPGLSARSVTQSIRRQKRRSLSD